MSAEVLFNLSDDEFSLAKTKNDSKNKLGFAVLLKYFQLEGHYPKATKFVDPLMVNCLANQLNLPPSLIDNFDWEGRSTERYRQEIRDLLGFKAASANEIEKLKSWLIKEIFPNISKESEYIEHAYHYFCEQRLEPFTSKKLERHIHSAHNQFEQQLFSSVHHRLPSKTITLMNTLLTEDKEEDNNVNKKRLPDIKFRHLKKDVPGAKLKHVVLEVKKMESLKQLQLPKELIGGLSRKVIKKYYSRVLAEPPSSIREHRASIRYATFALFCYFRSQLIIDNATELLIQLMHKMQTSAEKFITKKIVGEIKRVNGKFDILYLLANAAVLHPTGVIEDIIYPEVEKQTLDDLVKELGYKGKWYSIQVQTKMRSLYSHAHRKTLLTLLDAFTFNTHLPKSQLVLDALAVIKKYRDSASKYYPTDVVVPIQQVVPSEWQSMVVEVTEGSHQKSQKNGEEKPKKIEQINRMNYEIATLHTLCKQLDCKMIWVEGAYRFQDPDKDLPQDYEENREHYYHLMGLPLDAREFTSPYKKCLQSSLKALNEEILTNEKVQITRQGRIKVSPSEAQAEPANIKKLQREIRKKWPMINLIDILKETDLQIGFTDKFSTAASRENLSKELLQQRLLLCLYGIGTNTGLKPISAANEQVNYSELRYVKRRYITVDSVRAALVEIINRTLAIRDPRIWGEATTGVACDSKKMSVWDQNLMVEWHSRYRGRGVMVYWHVEKKALCIYSQLKTCSSSEVGSMIKGILQHCTEMMIDKAYMDTHGQSTFGFGSSEFLHFDLLPRLKNINKQTLYYASSKHKNDYDNLGAILKSAIHWDFIEESYDDSVKHMVALKLGLVEPDVLIKRFSKENHEHPVYRGIVELGKVSKTIFLCRYLKSEALRIEIHEAQNVVERVNSIMRFIFYGKLGEISTNVKEDQELAIVSLHLLQACMGYINTLLLQDVLSSPEWKDILTPEDKRALNVLMHAHINPYGLFPLDLKKRLGITADNLGKRSKETHEINNTPKENEKEEK